MGRKRNLFSIGSRTGAVLRPRADRPLEGAPVTQEMADIFLGNEKPLSKAQDGIEGVCVTSNIGFETFSLQISICSDVTKINHKTWTFCSRNVCQCC